MNLRDAMVDILKRACAECPECILNSSDAILALPDMQEIMDKAAKWDEYCGNKEKIPVGRMKDRK